MKILALAIVLAAVVTPAHAHRSQRLGFMAEYSCAELAGSAERLLAQKAGLSPLWASSDPEHQPLMAEYQRELIRLDRQMSDVYSWRRYHHCPYRY
ncbi:MAG TPA: hypothetical protein VHP58_03190 [Alphaproteobacteria bacterium]|nr:hypothetical protein [Alphaproteobacteria bacterium]